MGGKLDKQYWLQDHKLNVVEETKLKGVTDSQEDIADRCAVDKLLS